MAELDKSIRDEFDPSAGDTSIPGGVECPQCGAETAVRKTLRKDGAIERRRKCKSCAKYLTTLERIVRDEPPEEIPDATTPTTPVAVPLPPFIHQTALKLNETLIRARDVASFKVKLQCILMALEQMRPLLPPDDPRFTPPA